MDIQEFREMTEERVLALMLEFMEDCEDYTAADVDRCRDLIFDYLDALGAMEDPTDDQIMAQVEKLVLALNELNEELDYVLIETEQREAIWEVIQSSAVARGLRDVPEDVTEQWREW